MNYLAINPKVSMFLTKDAYNIIIEKEDSNKEESGKTDPGTEDVNI